ncbi:MAG: hypothetical protein AB9917_21715 [Negativicutes bacterium]
MVQTRPILEWCAAAPWKYSSSQCDSFSKQTEIPSATPEIATITAVIGDMDRATLAESCIGIIRRKS